MQQMRTPIIWTRLLVEENKVVTSEYIRSLAKRIGKSESRSLSYLQEHGYIARILRGTYYVRSADERERDYCEWSVFRMIAEALKLKGIKNWYFGLETALKLNGMTHEYFTLNYVFTDGYWASKPITIRNGKFQFFKRSLKFFGTGIVKKDGIRFSDKERTVLDIVYNTYRRSDNDDIPFDLINEYRDRLESDKLKSYVSQYPKRFQNRIGEYL